MSPEFKIFIEENINLIEEDSHQSWVKFYDNIKEKHLYEYGGQITQTLLSANIDPGKKLKMLPNNYLNNSSIEAYNIPEGVEIILMGAFENSPNLKYIKLPSTIKILGGAIFANCPKLKSIDVNMKAEDFINYDKVKLNNFERGSQIEIINCIDNKLKRK